MIEPAIVSVGHTKFGVLDAKAHELLRDAIREALEGVDKGIKPKDIDAVFVANFASDLANVSHWGPLALRYLGNLEADAYRIESACASGGFALYNAWKLVRAGVYSTVLVVGIEKMSNATTAYATETLARAAAPEEIVNGYTFPGAFALMARVHMRLYGTKEEHLAMVAVKNHEHALLNPKAHFHTKITVEDVLKSPIVASPIKLYDCSPISDGAAAVIVTSKPRSYTDTPVYIKHMSTGFDHPGLYERDRLDTLRSVKIASRKLYRKARITPKKLHIIELHDCFTIAEIMQYEDLGLARKGEGYKLLEEGVTWIHGSLPVNVSGGLKAKGHPVGATGVSQAVEMFLQLRGEAGSRQVKDVELGLTVNLGGSGASAVVALYSR